jgi:hypothetical protein
MAADQNRSLLPNRIIPVNFERINGNETSKWNLIEHENRNINVLTL